MHELAQKNGNDINYMKKYVNNHYTKKSMTVNNDHTYYIEPHLSHLCNLYSYRTSMLKVCIHH